MSNSATFELKTSESITTIQNCVSQLWRGYAVNVFVQEVLLFQNVKDSVFCILEYIFGEPEEESTIREVVSYLLSIYLNQEIYYYRCSDFIGLVDPKRPIVEIEIEDLFSKEYAPSIGASLEQKYKIRLAKKEMDDPPP